VSYNGSGTFVVNSSGQPVVTGTVISSTAFNALTADLATGLSTAITKDGQTTTTARITFAQGVSSTLVTDATSATTGSIITAGGISTQKALWVGTTATIAGATTMAGITATSLALGGATLGTNALAVTGTTQLNSALNYGGVTLSNAVTGTGNMVLSASPTLTGTLTAAAANFSGAVTVLGTTNPVFAVDASSGANTTYAISKLIANGHTYGLLAGGSGTPDLASSFGIYDFTNSAYRLTINSSGLITLPNAINYGGVTLSNSVTGTGSMVLSASPAFTGSPTYTNNQNAQSIVNFTNNSSGANASAIFQTGNGTSVVNFGVVGTNTTPNGIISPNRGWMYSSYGVSIIGDGSSDIRFASGGTTEVARFGSDGSFLVGTTTNGGWTTDAKIVAQTSTSYALSAYNTNTAGAARITRVNSTACSYDLFYYGAATNTGSITTNGTTTAYNVTSDYRLKENVQPMTGGLATVAALKPVTYDWISNGSAGEGFIAHELQAVIPEAVTGKKDAVSEDGSINAQGVDFSKIVPHLVAAIQELTARLAALENK